MKTKKQLTNRILSLVLTLVMVISILPLSSLTAFAANDLMAGEILDVLPQDETMRDNGGTITTNNGTVENNHGTVENNDATGRVTDNFGNVENNEGTVVNNYGGTVGGTSAINNYYKLTYEADNVTVSGLTEKNGNSYILSTASVTLTPSSSQHITSVVITPEGATLTKNDNGTYTLSGVTENIELTVFTSDHSYSTEWKSDDTNHWHECTCGAKTEEATHSGGTATCTKKAICIACGEEYGELADHTKTYSVNEETNTITAACDTCPKVYGSATLFVPEFAYYTNSSAFSAGYSTTLKNGEEVKLTYNGYSETTPPSSLGIHTARLTVYENGIEKASVTAQYEITYLPAPQNPYSISGHSYYDETTKTYWFKNGATVTVNAPEGYTISTVLGDGYGESVEFSKGDDMVIYLKEDSGAMTDKIEVKASFDENAPIGKITVENRGFWEKLLNKITFGLFFKGDTVAKVSATDNESGWNSIQYYVAGEDLIGDDILDNAAAVSKLENAIGDNWKTYSNEIALNKNAKNVIYVKITDNVGNVTYLSSDGIVLDSIAPELYGIENGGVYYGDKVFKATDENFLKIELDGADITDTTEGDDEFVIKADNQEHTVTVTDKAGNVTEYTITVYKRYSVTFTDGEGGSYEKEFKYGEVITIPTNEFFEDTFRKTGYTLTGWQGYTEGMTMPLENLTFTVIYTPNQYAVEFDTNGGEAIASITVTFGEKYGSLPSSSVAGLSGGNKNWYLVDANGNVTETNIKNLTLVSTAREHKLFIKRNVLSPNVSITLTVPGGISDGYQYYIPGASQRILTATVNNANTELLNYTYQWYKDGTPIEGATASVLTLDGNVADSGTYKVEVTSTLKDGTGIVVTTSSATGSKEQNVKILHAANTLSYDANGGEGGPQSSYTGGTSLNVSTDMPSREHYDFIGWNTKADGSGDSYKAKDAYNFTFDGGNGGCTVTLYAQWKAKEYTVTYMADGQTVSTEKVEYGKDATLPAVPHKDGYVGKWDSNGKNITADTEINAVYTINKYTVTYQADGEVVIALKVEHGENVAFPELPKKDGYVGKWDRNNENITSDTVINAVYTEIDNVVPEELKTDDKTDLKDTKKQLENMLDDNSYTEDDKKAIQDAIDDIDDALEAIGNVEAVEELIDKLPDTIKKEDEATIKAAEDALGALTDYEKSLVDKDAKKALDDAKAALAELKKPADPNSPATGDNSNMFLWIALLFISGGAVITLTIVDRKRRTAKR